MDAIRTSYDIAANAVSRVKLSPGLLCLPNLIKSNSWTEARTKKLCGSNQECATNTESNECVRPPIVSSDPFATKRRLVLETPFSTRSTISYGLIVYAKDTKRWAIIQRKHSVEFLLFIRGLYRLTYLPLLLSSITREEADIIEKCLRGGPNIFRDIYLNYLNLGHEGLQYALIRMAESRNIVSKMLTKLNLTENELSWSWPKGRLHISSERETPFECAKREFIEEVEIKLPPPLFISDTYISETFRTITGRTIESRYWIYIIPNEIPMTTPKSHPEVSNRLWVDADTCSKCMHNDAMFKQINQLVLSLE